MEKHLLQKEEEFYKANDELELKTQQLMKEVENVMNLKPQLQKRANLSAEFKRQCPSATMNSKSLCISLVNTSETFSLQMSDVEDEGSYHELGVDKKISLLKNKIKRLQNDMQGLQIDYKRKNEEWKKLQAELKTSEEKCAKLQQKTVALTEALKKQEQHNANMSSRLSQKEMENNGINKELQALSKELKGAVKVAATTQVLLNHTVEERDKLHANIQHYKGEDREFRECNRKKMDEISQTVHKTEKGKSELLQICKVQMQLINNLKKQKIHLQAARMVQFTEEEFLKLLDWNPSSFSQ